MNSMRSSDLYIDLGTANTLIYLRGTGFVLNEPSVLALKHLSQGHKTFAIGQSAKAMLGKNPKFLSVLKPLKEGVIADANSTARMLDGFVSKLKTQTRWLRPRMIISLPCQVSHFEKKSVEEIGYNLGASNVHLLHEPIAAAIGANLPVLENRGCMIVDIGGGTTEIAIISMGGIINAQAVRIGGDSIDAAIISLMESKYRFAIGEQTAEYIKINVGSAIPSQAAIDIGGLDLTNGLPRKFRITSEMIFPAINSVVVKIIGAIRKGLEECPPEIAGDISQHGIVLAGGGALIKGIKQRITDSTGIPVVLADQPLMSVALGGARALENHKLFDALKQPA